MHGLFTVELMKNVNAVGGGARDDDDDVDDFRARPEESTRATPTIENAAITDNILPKFIKYFDSKETKQE